MTMEEQRRLRVPELARQLEAALQDKQLAGNQPIESTRQLASRYRVSPVTANRAINQLVARKVLYRIPGKGTFVMPRRAGGIRRIGLYLYPDYRQHTLSYALWFGMFHQYLIDLLKRKGYDISLISGLEKEDRSMLARTLGGTDALLLNKEMVTAENIPLLTGYGGPVILLEQPRLSDLPFHQVVPFLQPGVRAGGEHLAKLGVRSLVIAGAADTETHCYRRRIFRETLHLHFPQIELLEDLTHPYISYDYGEQCGELLASKYLQLPGRPAIFSVSDYVSFGLVRGLLAAGLKPGYDFKLVSYDNMEGHGVRPFSDELLTTIEHPFKSLIDETVALLERLLSNPDATVLNTVRVPADKLIVRTTA